MARSLLRASQLRDEDVMEEAEHDAWVHVNLVTSGTLNFQDGTISGTGDIYATTLYGDGSNLSGVGGGNPESLYYNTTDVRATASSDGINVTDGTYTADMHFDSGSNRFYIENKSGVEVRLTGESSGTRLLFVGQANGAASMYYAGSIKFQTVSDGVLVYNGSGDNLRLTGSGDDAIVRSITNDNNIVLQATDAAAEVKDVFRGDPDGSAELYYAGSKVMETISDGIQINDLAEPSRVTEIKQNDAITQIISRQHNGGIQIRLEDSNGTERPLFYGYANGTNPRVAIYAGSGVNVATFTDDGSEGGINIIRGSAPGTSGATVSMNTNNKIFYLRNNYDGGNVYIQGDSDNDTQVNMMALDPHGSWTFSSRNSGDTATNTLAIFDPDGAAELYYAGDKTVETTVSGIKINSGGEVRSDGTNVEFYHDGNKALETLSDGISINTNAYIQHDATDLIITNKTNAGALRFYANNGPDRERMQINTNNQTFGNTGATELYLDHNNGDIYLKASPNDYIWVRDRGAHHIEFHTNSKLAMDMDDGSVDLYYDGNKKFETTVSGIEVTGAIEQNGERIYTQSEVDELITTLSGALQAQIDTLLAL